MILDDAVKRLQTMGLATSTATVSGEAIILTAETYNGSKFKVAVFDEDDPALDKFFARIEMELELIRRGVLPPVGWW